MPHTRPVLIAEDDEDMIFMLQRSLRKAGVRNPVTIVNDGEQAINFLEDETGHKQPGLALLDIRMPLKDGFDVLKRVRANPKLCRIPVVILSSSNAAADVSRAYDLGANSYVVKPGDTFGIDRVVGKIHEYWLSVNEPALPLA